MSVESASFSTGVMRPPSGMLTASATLMLSLYVMPPASVVHAAVAPQTHRHHTPLAQDPEQAPAARAARTSCNGAIRKPRRPAAGRPGSLPLFQHHMIHMIHMIPLVVPRSSRPAPAGGSSARQAALQGDGGAVRGDDCSQRPARVPHRRTGGGAW